MSQSLNNDFDNNQNSSASDMQNVNNDANNLENGAGTNQSDNNESSTSNSADPIQSKLDAVKDFSFCMEGNKKIPVFPYAVALTGHRDAIITDEVRQTAQQQLRSLAKAWSSSSLNWFNYLLNQTVFTRKYIANKPVPLIVLIGMDDGESGRFWAQTAAKLRDEEHFNIKIVAVANMPLRILYDLANNHPDQFSKPEDSLDLSLVDGIIELPLENDVLFLLGGFETLESYCTDAYPNTRKLFDILMTKDHIYEMQFEEYRKFMCVHSHALIVLTDNVEAIRQTWEEKNKALNDFASLTNNSSQGDMAAFQNELTTYRNNIKIASKLNELIQKVYNLRLHGKEPDLDLINTIETLASKYTSMESDNVPGQTEAMITHKLFGNIKAKINPYEVQNGISFPSVGPVVCIPAKRSSDDSPGNDSQNDQNGGVTIIVRDQPDDDSYELTKSFTLQNITNYAKIRDIFRSLGLANRSCLNYYNLYSKENSDNSDAYSDDRVPDLKSVIDDNTETLYAFYHYTRFLKSHFYQYMKRKMFSYAIMAVVVIFCISFFSSFITFYPGYKYSTSFSLILSLLFIYLIFLQFSFSCSRFPKLYHYFHALFVGLKVQLYWKLAGIDQDAPGKFNLHQIDEITWIRVALNGLYITLPVDKSAAIDVDIATASKEQAELYLENRRKQLEKCITVKENWVYSEFEDVTGKSKDSRKKFKDSVENKLGSISTSIIGFFKTLLEKCYNWGQIESFLQWLSPFGGKIAFIFYLAPFILPIKYYLNTRTPLLNSWLNVICQYTIVNALLISIYIVITLFLCVLIVYNAYRSASLKELDIKRRSQLLYPFHRACLLLNLKLAYWKEALQKLEDSQRNDEALSQKSGSENYTDKDSSNYIVEKSYNEFRILLEDLGRIKLAICAEWYLGLKQRKLNVSMPHSFSKLDLSLAEAKFKE